MQNTSSSPTLSLRDLMSGPLSTISRHLVQSASLQEDHADGGTHLHAFIAFERKFRSRRPDIFDVDGYHPNIVPSRGNPGGGYDYATKDRDIVAGGLERPGGGGVSKASTPWHWIISASSGENFGTLFELAPKEAVLRYREIEHFIACEFAEERPPYVHPIGFEFELGMVPQLVDWRRDVIDFDRVEGKCTAALNRGGRIGAEAPAPGIGCLFMFLLIADISRSQI